jgi:hypothetical protein
MSEKEIASAVRRKRSKKQGVGGKPTNVATFAAEGGSIMKMKSKGYAKGGAMMKSKGMAKGGAMNKKPAGKMRPPSKKNSGLYG